MRICRSCLCISNTLCSSGRCRVNQLAVYIYPQSSMLITSPCWSLSELALLSYMHCRGLTLKTRPCYTLFVMAVKYKGCVEPVLLTVMLSGAGLPPPSHQCCQIIIKKIYIKQHLELKYEI